MYERRIFSAMVTGLDKAIGRIVKALREEGLYENSIILFSSDVRDQFRKIITITIDFHHLNRMVA